MKATLLIVCVLWAVGACARDLNYTTVFQHGEGGYPCIRIPSITQCKGVLHAFAECRTRTGDGCVPTTARGKTGEAGTLDEMADKIIQAINCICLTEIRCGSRSVLQELE